MSWAYSNFQLWLCNRNTCFPEDRCPENILDKTPWDSKALSFWLCRYVCETRKEDGSKYPPSSLHCLLAGLLRHMRSIDPACPNILDTSDVRFRDLHSTIDATFRKLREDGVGAEVKHASVITKQEENLLWEKGVLGTKSLAEICVLLQRERFLPKRWKGTSKPQNFTAHPLQQP